MHHIWIELKKVGYGFKLLNDDFKYFLNIYKKKYELKYEKPSYKAKVKLA